MGFSQGVKAVEVQLCTASLLTHTRRTCGTLLSSASIE